MTKRALISTLEEAGNPNNPGQRMLEVVETGQEFETDPAWYWVDCPDHVESYKYYYKDNQFLPLPTAIPQQGTLALNEDGTCSQDFVFNWDTNSWEIIDVN